MNGIAMVVILRAIHILCGVIWVGGLLALGFFTGPSAETDSAGLRAMLAFRKRTLMWARLAAVLAILAGMALYGMLHGGPPRSTSDLVLSAGAVLALLSFAPLGILGGRAGRTLTTIARAVENREPSADEVRQIRDAYARGRLAAQVTAAFLVVAVICMAIWRYL
jgi:uncharacterized membrane protein